MEQVELIVIRILANDLSCDDLINQLKKSSSEPLEEIDLINNENIKVNQIYLNCLLITKKLILIIDSV
jgi:hypothetical protein